MDDHPRHLELVAASASAEEAAAVVAALERFMRATARAEGPSQDEPDRWMRAAILEGLSREEQGEVRDPWINP